MILIIVGESASGKTTLAKRIENDNTNSFSRIVTYTTRPPRDGEFDTIDYHFVNDEVFDNMIKQDMFVEYTNYRGWQYGTAINFGKDENKVVVLNPTGARAFKRYIQNHPELGLDIFVVYLNVDRRSRLIRMLQRDSDIDECCRRSLSDEGQFAEFGRESDLVIYNDNYKKTVDEIYCELLLKLKQKKLLIVK